MTQTQTDRVTELGQSYKAAQDIERVLWAEYKKTRGTIACTRVLDAVNKTELLRVAYYAALEAGTK